MAPGLAVQSRLVVQRIPRRSAPQVCLHDAPDLHPGPVKQHPLIRFRQAKGRTGFLAVASSHITQSDHRPLPRRQGLDGGPDGIEDLPTLQGVAAPRID